MTFNIRYGTAPDGDDAWPHRRGQALQTIMDFGPTLLAVQEALRFQLDELGQALPGYAEVGVGRDDGIRAGEYAAILYQRARLDLLDQGRFWLSATPEQPGSMTWGNRYPRIVTWARFADRGTAATFTFYNTHWDHESEVARSNGAALMRRRIAARPGGAGPVLVAGDFNAGEDNAALRALLAPIAGEDPPGPPLRDSFRVLHPDAQQVGTYHAFRGGRDGPKIDAVLVSPEWRVLDAAIVRTSAGGHYPSDHFPVTAIVTLPPP